MNIMNTIKITAVYIYILQGNIKHCCKIYLYLDILQQCLICPCLNFILLLKSSIQWYTLQLAFSSVFYSVLKHIETNRLSN